MKITKSTFLGQNSGLEEGHGNVERVSQPCLNENYRKLSQLHACRTRLFLLDANNHHPHWVVICPYKDATSCWKNFNTGKLSSRTISKGMSKGISTFEQQLNKLYLIWTQISQCQFPNNFEFAHSNILKFCVCSNLETLKSQNRQNTVHMFL